MIARIEELRLGSTGNARLAAIKEPPDNSSRGVPLFTDGPAAPDEQLVINGSAPILLDDPNSAVERVITKLGAMVANVDRRQPVPPIPLEAADTVAEQAAIEIVGELTDRSLAELIQRVELRPIRVGAGLFGCTVACALVCISERSAPVRVHPRKLTGGIIVKAIPSRRTQKRPDLTGSQISVRELRQDRFAR